MCIPWYLFCTVPFRSELRKDFNIKGTQCGDCLYQWCCLHFALCQERREIEVRERLAQEKGIQFP